MNARDLILLGVLQDVETPPVPWAKVFDQEDDAVDLLKWWDRRR